MTNPDELERRLQEAADAAPGSHAGYADSGWVVVVQNDLRLILAANRKMRAALEWYGGAHQFPSDGPWGVNSDDFGQHARSSLSTKED
jgi:hypothetical protein